MRSLGLAGLSVTMPHKADVVRALDELTPTAAVLEAVNTIIPTASGLLGDNTDGAGFIDAVEQDEGFDPAGTRCVVLGAGGAARAVLLALSEAGAREIVIVNRSVERAEEAATLAPRIARPGGAEAADAADLVVNCTPVGMGGDGGMPIEAARLASGQLVVDLIYYPPVTPFLAAAKSRGATAVNGLGTLIHQAGRQFRLWTGSEPPLEVMSAAASASLALGTGDEDIETAR
jgi:shikimate dehydrogenase